MIKKDFVRLFVILLVVMCGSISLKTANAQYPYPILKLDINNSDTAAETEPGFTSFTIGDSGSEIDGIKIEITGTLDSRRRTAPAGIPFEQIYRDFVFSRPGGMTITLSGLVPNQAYEISIYAFDTGSGSGGDRIADWTANGVYLLTAGFNAAQTPTSEYDKASWAETTADDTGTIVLECGPNENTAEETGESNPYGFINALEVYSNIPVTKARRPQPATGTMQSETTVNLSWLPGGYAASHDVYLSDSLVEVDAAASSDPMGPGEVYKARNDANSFTVENLTAGVTYYWRVDEVNDLQPDSPWKGDIWSFTVASKSAFQPIPVDGSLFIDPNVTISWTKGAGSVIHFLYFGDNLDDVQAGTGGTNKGTIGEPNYHPGLLELEKTYYWRIDEFDGMRRHTGDVWSFTTTLEDLGTVGFDLWEDVTGNQLTDLTDNANYPSNPSSSSELTLFSVGTGPEEGIGDNYGGRIHGWLYVPLTGDYTLWLTCADQGELWLSTDDDPANVQLLASEPTWGWYGAFNRKSDPISLIGGNRYYIMAIWKEGTDWDHCQVAWQGAGIRYQEIIQGNYLSPYRPVNAYAPTPKDGSTFINQTPMFFWTSGKNAISHNLYLGVDPNALNQIATLSAAQNKYGPLAPPLDVNQTYYWRIDEVNDLHPDSPWIGQAWSFTTADYIVVDDFEDYNDVSNRIYDTWGDYYVNNTGMTVGHIDPPFAEGTIVHYGAQSMYVRYDNDGAVNEGTSLEQSGTQFYSEAEREWDDPQDWAGQNAESLTLWFRGIPASVGSFTQGPPITITAGGTDIFDTADEFHFAYKQFYGEGSIAAKVLSVSETDVWAKAGVMIRQSLDPGSVNVAMVVTPSSGVSFQYRAAVGAGTEEITETDIRAPQWVRLTRTGNTFIGQYSANGTIWTTLGSVDVPMLLDVYAGLCLTSHNVDETCTAEFSNVTMTGTVTGDWQSQDIGINSNIAEPLYVVLEDSAGNSALANNPDPAASITGDWTQWIVPFADFPGVNMQAIKKISIGVGDKASTQPGTAGDLYIDDIGLYPSE